MVLTGETPSSWGGGHTCPSATLCITNLSWTGVGSNPGLCAERLAEGKNGTTVVSVPKLCSGRCLGTNIKTLTI
jgi:hypothetical protein